MIAKWKGKTDRRGGFTHGKIYQINSEGFNDICFVTDDKNFTRSIHINEIENYFTITNKYPNIKIFREIYPNGKVNGNFWEVPFE